MSARFVFRGARRPALMGLVGAMAVVAACRSTPSPSPASQTSTAPAAADATAPAAADATAPATASRITSATFSSPALGVDKRYNVYLPPGYDAEPDRRYPVLYLLHGLGGDEDNWPSFGVAEAAATASLQAILVMPDGDDSFYANWVDDVDYDRCLASQRPFGWPTDMKTYCVRAARYEDYIVEDLVGHIDETYRTQPRADQRAIGGFSMGGFGALMLAMRHPDVFGTAVSHAGVASLRYAGPDPYTGLDDVQLAAEAEPYLDRLGRFGALYRRIFGTEISHWKAHDPAALAAVVKPAKPALYLDAGTEDGFRLHLGAQHVRDVLAARGLPHTFALVEGGRHDPAFVRNRLPDSLAFVAARFAEGASPKGAASTGAD